ncbi:MAG: sortase [Chloroflexota bacterium]
MPRRKAPEDLSVEELRRLLIEKRRGVRRERLEHFRKTGRVVDVDPPLPIQVEEDHVPAAVVDTAEGTAAPDETASSPQGGAGPGRGSKRRGFAERVLLAVEVLAVVGLVGILLAVFGVLRSLNQEVAAALNPETPTPTPLVMAVVLPSGHTPPDAQGNTRPNEAEIPEHLRPLVQSLANIPLPTPAPDQAVRLQVPRLKVDAPVVQGDGWEQLKKGVGQHIGSANPGQNGNVVLTAHNDVYGELFRYLDQLQPGDNLIVYTQQRQYVYVVERTVIVEPTAVEVMASTGSPTVTLISCYPYLVDSQRIVVFARLQN